MVILANADRLPTWNADELTSVLHQVRTSLPALEIEWNLAAGEGWARIWSDTNLCAAVRAPTTANTAIRFSFLRRSSLTEPLKRVLDAANVATVEIEDFDAPSLSVQMVDLESFVDGPLPPLHVFDPAHFAANDLVFVTE
jgi:hypothetical protein